MSYRHCITESAAERQRQFEQALLELMGKESFSQISVQEICLQVGLSRKSFYRYFSGKEACLAALVDHTILDFTELSSPGEEPRRVLEAFFVYWLNHRDLLEALHRNGLENILYEQGMECTVREYGLRESFLRGDGLFEQSIFFMGGLFVVLLQWHLSGCQKTPAQLAAILERYLKI